MSSYNNWIGLDFGSQKGDTTAIAFFDSTIQYEQSTIKEDTDDWIMNWVKEHHRINQIFIDAPLSLPAAYYKQGNDYMYRKADREVNAMSPMFLGGLTARAMRLKEFFSEKNIELIETYPAHLEKTIFGSKSPKKGEWSFDRFTHLQNMMNVKAEKPANRHQYDALLAWVSAWRFHKGEIIAFGDPSEGVIHV